MTAGLVRLSLAFLLAGCASTTPTPATGETSSSVSPTETVAAPTTTGAASPSPTPSATATNSPTLTIAPPPTTSPPSQLTIKWINPPGASNLADLLELTGYARQGNRFVIVGSRSDPSPEVFEVPAIWWSDDATEWQPAQLVGDYRPNFPYDSINDVAAGGPGFVAIGGWLPLWSADGKTWTAGTGDPLPDCCRLRSLGASEAGLIAIGRGESGALMARQSTDGKTWSDASEVGALIGTEDVDFETGDALLAFARPSRDGQPTVVWRMSTVGVWQKIGEIDDYYEHGAYGPDGWIVVGANAVWLSPHGANWTRMPSRPDGGAAAVLPDKTGFVVTTAIDSGGGCIIDLGDFTGQTWTSVDGASWVKMRQEWYGRGLAALFALDRKLVGVGTAWEDGDSFGFVRTANLPLVQGVAGAVPSLAPSPRQEEGCGP